MIRTCRALALAICALVAAHTRCVAKDQEGQVPSPAPLERHDPEHTTPFHFLVDTNVNTAYYTPRGLMVENEGASFHLLVLGILDVYKNSQGPVNSVSIIAGAWNNFLTHAKGPGPNGTQVNVSPYNEVDPIVSVEGTIFDDWTLGATYVPFISPPNLFPGGAQHNFEFKVAFDDSRYMGPFALHPYVKPFWHFAGPSPVVLGESNAWDFELGINPSVSFLQDSTLPMKLNFPIFMTFGNSAWFGGPGTALGHVAPTFNLSFSLAKLIDPATYGIWSLYLGGEYSRIVNDNLLLAGNILSGQRSRNVFIGTMGVNLFVP